MRFLAFLTGSLLLFAGCGFAAEQSGIFGVVRDVTGHVLPDIDLQVQSESTGARWRVRSNDDGRYAVEGLPPGRYKVTVRMPGFRTVSRVGVVLDVRQGLPLDFAMELLGLHEVITVVGGRDDMDPAGGDSLLVTRGSAGAALPANGRDYRMLFDLMPGVVVTPAGASDAGQFTSNGQRPNASTFRVDGVSANTGAGGSSLPGSFPGASLPAMTAMGTTENVGSPETTQSVELRTSAFAPESGERPGSEAIVTTRSGSNSFHGEFFGRVRDNAWNARDWFANSRGLALPRPSYRSLGGVFGGPIRHNRTFFFASVEKSQLFDSGLQLTSVPSLAARQNAPEKLKLVVDSFPYASGRDLGGGEAEGLLPLTRNASLTSYGARIDQSLGSHGTLFGRFVESPSASQSGGMAASTGGISSWRSVTAGLTAGTSGGAVHDLRFNYSHAGFHSRVFGISQFAFGLAGILPVDVVTISGGPDGQSSFFNLGSVPPNLTSVLPPTHPGYTTMGLSLPGLGQFTSGDYGQTRQDQWELRETFSGQSGRHQFRAGIDYIRLTPSRDVGLSTILGTATSLQGLLNGDPLAIAYSQIAPRGATVHMVSLFAQDTFRVGEFLNLVYGLRWEVTPPTAGQVQIPTVSGLWTGTEWKDARAGDINGTAPWPMRFGQFAPRLGLAWRVPKSSLVLRAGAGVFYDPTLGAATNPINGAPFNSWQLSAGGTGLDASAAGGTAAQGGTGADVTRFLLGPQPPLRLPMSYQWRASLEKGFGSQGVASLAYLGAAGKHLLGNQAYVEPGTGILERLVTLTTNSSNYQALQVRYSGSLASNVYGSASYTWSHSIDDGSQDSSIFLVHPGYQLSEARGSSNFDVRHALTLALSYRIPRSAGLPDWLAGWTISGIFRAHGGFPINITNGEQSLGLGFDNVGRPDLVPAVPIWIDDESLAGHRRLNPAAFSVPPAGSLGTLGRNAISGNGLAQWNVSLQREFAFYWRTSVEVGLNVFNVLNHPAFADAVPALSSPWFGQSTSMQNLMLGSGTPNTGLPALFQTGGSRSAEFSFRVSF